MKYNNNMTKESAEHVLPGHPDKLCDAIVDSIVEQMRLLDSGSQCGLEAAVIFNSIYLTGRIAGSHEALKELNIKEIVKKAWSNAGYGTDESGHVWGPVPAELSVITNFCFGEFEPNERELRHLSDDQAICVGYACNCPETEFMPPAHWLARTIARTLFELRRSEGAGEMGPDGKVIVQIERNGREWHPTVVSLSLNHHNHSNWLLLRRIAEQAIETSCQGMPTPRIEMNGAGSFVSGGPNGDNGLSGKKLVVDAYGPTVPIGGGAWSGKDLRKVDRLGGLLARELALKAVRATHAKKVIVRLSYFPGSDAPRLIEPFVDGNLVEPKHFLHTIGAPDLSNKAVWKRYRQCDIPLPELARWGHQQSGTPWEIR